MKTTRRRSRQGLSPAMAGGTVAEWPPDGGSTVAGADATERTSRAAKKTPRTYSRHGLSPLKATVRVRGLAVLDRRTGAARALLEHRQALIADLGGDAAISTQQRGVIEMAVRTRLLIDHGAAFLLEQRSLVNGRKRSFIPLVRELQTLVDSYVRILTTLGLERRARPAKSLHQVMAEMAAERAAADATQNGPQDAGKAPQSGEVVEAATATLPDATKAHGAPERTQ